MAAYLITLPVKLETMANYFHQLRNIDSGDEIAAVTMVIGAAMHSIYYSHLGSWVIFTLRLYPCREWPKSHL